MSLSIERDRRMYGEPGLMCGTVKRTMKIINIIKGAGLTYNRAP